MAAVNHRALLDAAPRGQRVVATAFTLGGGANTYQEVYLPPYNLLASWYLSVTVADGRYCGPAATGSAAASATDGAASTPTDFPLLVSGGSEMQGFAIPDATEHAASPAVSESVFVTGADATTKFHFVYVRK